MANEGISHQLQGLNLAKDQDINILLLGETGVGKSTFINSLANYLLFKSYKKAAKSKLHILIPAQFIVTNKYFEQIRIDVGASDSNEYLEVGASSTQNVKTYVFPIGDGKTRLRLIDTPGMGDPRGIEQDDINCDNILEYLAQLHELHAICFLMKPTNTRITILFEYCVKQILSRLEKSASKNIIFIFTNTRGSNYTAGETLPCLRKVVEDIKAKPPHVDIPSKTNVFCLDNEGFRFLAAIQQNVEFSDDIQARFVESWKNSSAQCGKLISYIMGDASNDPLKPHQLKNTISINEARRIIVQLSQPLADISQLIYDNIRILERHQNNLRIENQSMDELKKKLYIPTVELQVTQLTQPVTVCTSTKCAEFVAIGDGQLKKWHFRQRCHDPCYLTNIKKEMIGDPGLINCAAMSGRICQKCTCDYSIHQHIYYMSKTVGGKIEDKIVKDNINQKEAALREARRLIGEIDKRKKELEDERDIIVKSTAQFAHFLQHNAIAPFNDSYKTYIEYLIKREEGLGTNSDRENIYNLRQLMRQYDEIKAAFDATLTANKQLGLASFMTSSDSADSVLNTIQKLYQLPNNGKKIQELLKKQNASRKSEYNNNCEYIHPKISKSKKDKKTDDEKKVKSKDEKKKAHRSTDEEKKVKTKSEKTSKDNEKQKNKPTSTNFSRGGFQQNNPIPPLMSPREPPPPYESFQRQQRRQQRQNEDDSDVCVVKVEVIKNNTGNKNSRHPQQPQQFRTTDSRHHQQSQQFHSGDSRHFQSQQWRSNDQRQSQAHYSQNPMAQGNFPRNQERFFDNAGNLSPDNYRHVGQNQSHYQHHSGQLPHDTRFHQNDAQCQCRECLHPGSYVNTPQISHGQFSQGHSPQGHFPQGHFPQGHFPHQLPIDPSATFTNTHISQNHPDQQSHGNRYQKHFEGRNPGFQRGRGSHGGRGQGRGNIRGRSHSRKGGKSEDEKSRRSSSSSSSSSSSDSSD